MTILALSPRDRRVLVWGGAVIAAAWLGTRGIPAVVRSASALRAEAEAELGALRRARLAVAEERWARDSLAVRARRLVAAAPRVISGATRSEATAELGGLVTGLANSYRVRVSRIEPLPDTALGFFVMVGVRAEAEGDVTGVGGWLARLESGDPGLAIRSLAVQAPEPARPRASPEVLRVEIVVRGLALLKREEER